MIYIISVVLPLESVRRVEWLMMDVMPRCDQRSRDNLISDLTNLEKAYMLICVRNFFKTGSEKANFCFHVGLWMFVEAGMFQVSIVY